MMNLLRADFKKLLSVRSTYGVLLVALALIGVGAFYGEGFKDVANTVPGPAASIFLAGTITKFSTFISIFAGITALLLLAHEYRYNTITYSLTATNSRSKFLTAKIITVFIYTLIFATVLSAYGLVMTVLGTHFSHHVLPHQDINYLTYAAKSIYDAEGYALAALVFVALIRNLVGAFAAFLLVPGPVEGLLSLLLRQNANYLPFTALSEVVQPPVIALKNVPPAHMSDNSLNAFSAVKGAWVFLIYLVIGWAVAWYLFLKRDAT